MYRDLPFEQAGVAVLKKFLNCLPLDVQHNIMKAQNKIVFWVPKRHRESPLLKDVFNIVMDEQAFTIKYASKNNISVRTIVPIGLYSMNGLWYCPAYCLKANAIREFRVDRMMEIIKVEEWHNEKKDIPNTIHEYLKNSTAGFDYHIKINLTPQGVKYCESETLLAHGLKIQENGGYIEMDISKTTLDWLAGYLLPLGNNATIIEPLKLKELVESKVRELYFHYCQ